MAGHGGARVACASQRAGRHRLHSVEELEKATDEKQSARGADYHRVWRVNPGDVLGRRQKKYGHHAHETGGEKHSCPAGATGGVRIAASESLADANGSGSAESQGNHVGETHGVECDLMAGERDGA